MKTQIFSLLVLLNLGAASSANACGFVFNSNGGFAVGPDSSYCSPADSSGNNSEPVDFIPEFADDTGFGGTVSGTLPSGVSTPFPANPNNSSSNNAPSVPVIFPATSSVGSFGFSGSFSLSNNPAFNSFFSNAWSD